MPCVLATLALAGCGGETRATKTTTTPQRTASPMEAADCLNTVQFIVEHGARTVSGSAPDGVNFTATFYGSEAAAKAELARLNPTYAVTMGKAVIDFHGNPPRHPGGAPMVLIHDDLVTLRHCILPR